MAEQRVVERIIRLAEEGRLAPVAALGDVVRDARQDQARGSRHCAALHENRNFRQHSHAKARSRVTVT
jgi:hypothetical protein